MGTKMAPAYVGLYMATGEGLPRLTGRGDQRTASFFGKDSTTAIWIGNKVSLHRFLDGLNRSDPDLKFTWNIDGTTVNYLDVDVYKGPLFSETCHLNTRTHIKETHSFQNVHASSCHRLQSSREWSLERQPC